MSITPKTTSSTLYLPRYVNTIERLQILGQVHRFIDRQEVASGDTVYYGAQIPTEHDITVLSRVVRSFEGGSITFEAYLADFATSVTQIGTPLYNDGVYAVPSQISAITIPAEAVLVDYDEIPEGGFRDSLGGFTEAIRLAKVRPEAMLLMCIKNESNASRTITFDISWAEGNILNTP